VRIASLLPSATELLCAIPGGAELLVARSHECDFPPGVRTLPVLTGSRLPSTLAPSGIDRAVREQLDPATGSGSLYTLNADLLAALHPDIILTQDLCHVCSIDLNAVRSLVSRLADPKPRIIAFQPGTFEGVLDDLLRLGREIRLESPAASTLVALVARMNRAQEHVNAYNQGPSVAFLDWTDPLFIAGHWTPQLIERAGASHPLNPTEAIPGSGAAAGPQQASRRAKPSFHISPEALVRSQPERLIICPCGVALDRASLSPGHAVTSVEDMARALAAQEWWHELPAVRMGHVALVDGNQMFSRPGPRLVDAYEWLVGWIQDRPDLMPRGFPWRAWKAHAP
jgi:ABC-type Fe3+-hydroxamate transport system substrate-binding protein